MTAFRSTGFSRQCWGAKPGRPQAGTAERCHWIKIESFDTSPGESNSGESNSGAEGSVNLARPKSSTLTIPSRRTMTFSGLMCWCVIPASCVVQPFDLFPAVKLHQLAPRYRAGQKVSMTLPFFAANLTCLIEGRGRSFQVGAIQESTASWRDSTRSSTIKRGYLCLLSCE